MGDDFSCQQHCLDLDECHFFTMYGVKDTPKDHMKCFMFKTCDHLEPCPECTTGPDHPPMPHPLPPCDPPNYICPTERQNILDVDEGPGSEAQVLPIQGLQNPRAL